MVNERFFAKCFGLLGLISWEVDDQEMRAGLKRNRKMWKDLLERLRLSFNWNCSSHIYILLLDWRTTGHLKRCVVWVVRFAKWRLVYDWFIDIWL